MFDLIIIGGGPGGYHMAIQASEKGLNTAVIEGDKFGGTCLNVGCIPSKAFLHFTKIVSEANRAIDDGVEGEKLKINQEQVVEYKDKKVDFLVKGTEAQVKASGATIIRGWAKILERENEFDFKVQVGDEVYTSKKLVIATGSKPFIPDFIKGATEFYDKGSVDSKILTSNEILSLKSAPENLVIIGAGVIGLELGSHFTWAGSKITIIDIAHKIGGTFDTDVSKAFQTAWANKGINFQLNSEVKEITDSEVIFINRDGDTKKIPYDKVLLAVGRVPNTDGLGLENIQELETFNGSILTDNKLMTNIKGLYAIGDVNGKLQLAHTAYREAEVALENILGNPTKINYDAIPSVLYAKPEISEIGINEDRAKREGLDVTVKKIPLMYSGRFVIEVPKYKGEQLKVIIDNRSDEIIGMSIYGQYASEMIGVGSIIVGERFDIDRVKKLVFSHPTVHELIKEVVNH